MSGEHKEKSPVSGKMALGIGLILIGVILGASISEGLSPWINPGKAQLVENTESILAQNKLLKEQVDCLVNGINQSHGKAAIDECT